MKNKLNIQYLVLLFFCIPHAVMAHDTTHVHPLITLNIAKLIKSIDLGSDKAYQEIYKLDPDPIISNNLPVDDQFLYWGTDFDPVGLAQEATSQAKQEYLVEDQYTDDNGAVLYGRKNNVVDGVVFEDNPAISKVRHHFYQAESGIPLTVLLFGVTALGESSNLRSMRFFNQSIELMGYGTEAAKQEAFFLFGQALHHVEDMTSPAHVHNDAHLDKLPLERDDYEGWWLPQQKQNEADLATYFAGATSITPITNPWTNIWGIAPGDNSLVQNTWRATTFNATLEYRFSVFTEIGNSYEYFSPPNTNDTLPTGEMAEMFPCPPPPGETDHCLHWSEDVPDAPAHWVINNVGGFQHQVQAGVDDAWWPVEIESDITTVTRQPAPFAQTYYIEQLASGNSETSPLGSALKPAKLRPVFADPDSWQQGMIDNSGTNAVPLLQKYAETLLAPAVTSGAGFTQYWYDIANPPPYLKSVKAFQIPSGSSNTIEIYSAQWFEVKAHEEIIDEEFGTVTRLPEYVASRTLDLDQSIIKHIHSGQALTLELTFSEPVARIDALQIGTVNVLSYVISQTSEDDGTLWKASIPASVLSGINGKQQMKVMATDRNKHTNGDRCTDGADTTGGALDGTPDTPARRNLSETMRDKDVPTGINCYPWYVKPEINPMPSEIAYSYDHTDGDQNHWLVFDTAPPAATISIDLSL